MLIIKVIFALAAAGVFVGGLLFIKDANRILGADSTVPNENESAQLLSKTQMVVLWLMSVKLLTMMAIIL